jgi:hypothetical protein
MQKQNIIFNLDDTPVYSNRYFNQVIEMFADQMTTWFATYTKEEIKLKQLEIDLESINKYGLTSARFPESFVGTYNYLGNRGNSVMPGKWGLKRVILRYYFVNKLQLFLLT